MENGGPVNPFQFTGVVGPEAFCNRKREVEELLRVIRNGEKLLVFSERRFGKTSLVRLAVEQLPKTRYRAAYVDLWPTRDEASFIAETARAITESVSNTADKLLDTGKRLFSRLIPSVTVEGRKPKVQFGLAAAGELELEEVLAAPARVAGRGRYKVVMVFDEIQQILEYPTDMVERRLRSIMQMQKKVSYIFLGSRKHLIQKMFMDPSRPLYRAAEHYPLPAIPEQEWIPFIRERFRAGGRGLSEDDIRAVCETTAGHPYYTQYLCHLLWDLPKPQLAEAVRILLEREHHAYAGLWESLAGNQKKLLRGLAGWPGSKPFAADFLRHWGLGTASSAQRAMKALAAKDIIERQKASCVICDRFFQTWIQLMPS